MRVFMEYANDINLSELDAEDFKSWDDWSREVVEVVWSCQSADGFYAKDIFGRKIEVLERDQERLGRPKLRDFSLELFKEGMTDLRDYAVRLYYEDEES